MTKIRDVLATNIVWVVTTAWIALIVMKALAVTRGNPVGAALVLAGPNLLNAALNAAGGLAISALSVIAPLSLMFASKRIRTRYGSRWTLTAWFLGLMSWMLLVLYAPAYLLIVSAFLGVATPIILYFTGRAVKKKPALSSAISAGEFQAGMLGLLGINVVLLVVLGRPWMQSETIDVAGSGESTGYVVAADSRWITILDDGTRTLRIEEIANIKSRVFCRTQNGSMPDWMDNPLVTAVRHDGAAALPAC